MTGLNFLVIVILLSGIIFLGGCTTTQELPCNTPYAKLGNVCCLDENNDSICDVNHNAFIPSLNRHDFRREFKERCKIYCKDEGTSLYCRYYYQGDWNNNGIPGEFVELIDLVKWYACEDRIYCFLVTPCERFGEDPIEGCMEQLCSSYNLKYLDNKAYASQAVLNTTSPTGQDNFECNDTLNSLPIENNWYGYYLLQYADELGGLCEHYLSTPI